MCLIVKEIFTSSNILGRVWLVENESYIKKVSTNYFFFGIKKRNWKPDGTLYYAQTELDYELQAPIFKTLSLNSLRKVDVWDFYKEIGWDRKSKKWK